MSLRVGPVVKNDADVGDEVNNLTTAQHLHVPATVVATATIPAENHEDKR